MILILESLKRYKISPQSVGLCPQSTGRTLVKGASFCARLLDCFMVVSYQGMGPSQGSLEMSLRILTRKFQPLKGSFRF